VFLVLAHDRRRILHCNVTAHPTAEWTGQQLGRPFPLTNSPATCCATAMLSSAMTSESRCETRASRKCWAALDPPRLSDVHQRLKESDHCVSSWASLPANLASAPGVFGSSRRVMCFPQLAVSDLDKAATIR